MDKTASRSAVSLFGLLVLALAVWSVDSTPWTAGVSVLLGVASVVLTLVQVTTGSIRWTGWVSGFECAFYLYAAGSMIAYMWPTTRSLLMSYSRSAQVSRQPVPGWNCCS
jgi:hypothetical protein